MFIHGGGGGGGLRAHSLRNLAVSLTQNLLPRSLADDDDDDRPPSELLRLPVRARSPKGSLFLLLARARACVVVVRPLRGRRRAFEVRFCPWRDGSRERAVLDGLRDRSGVSSFACHGGGQCLARCRFEFFAFRGAAGTRRSFCSCVRGAVLFWHWDGGLVLSVPLAVLIRSSVMAVGTLALLCNESIVVTVDIHARFQGARYGLLAFEGAMWCDCCCLFSEY